jgi:hypothetical protein
MAFASSVNATATLDLSWSTLVAGYTVIGTAQSVMLAS